VSRIAASSADATVRAGIGRTPLGTIQPSGPSSRAAGGRIQPLVMKMPRLFYRNTSTGIFEWVSTFWVTLPSSSAPMPPRP
jgi:hypothetical protein